MVWRSFSRALLFPLVDAESAHGLALAALKSGAIPGCTLPPDPRLAMTVAGLSFKNPLGMAAGFDKNAEVPDALMKLGFGFAEVGTLTPRPQPGNPRPRIFRLVEDEAMVNRLGFNNEGHASAHARLAARRGAGGVVGVNVGANKDSGDRTADYVAGIRRFAGVADYFTVNISSPNTPGLRDLQAKAALQELLARVCEARGELAERLGRSVPVFLKIAPDLDEAGLADIIEVVGESPIEGVIATNTTIARPASLKGGHRGETGGLSGRPLLEPSTRILARLRLALPKDKALIGVGGVHDAASALMKIEAGASLVQLYTGFVYGGPRLPAAILAGLAETLDARAVAAIGDLVGTRAEEFAVSESAEPA